MGFRGFVIPMMGRYGIPAAKSFLRGAAPEVINVLDGTSKPKAAVKNALKKTIRQQVGGGLKRFEIRKKRRVASRKKNKSIGVRKVRKSKSKRKKSFKKIDREKQLRERRKLQVNEKRLSRVVPVKSQTRKNDPAKISLHLLLIAFSQNVFRAVSSRVTLFISSSE